MREPPSNRRSKAEGPQLPASATRLDFQGQLASFAKATGEKLSDAHKNISIKLFTAIVYDTPVLTGQARGNWRPSMQTPRQGALKRTDKTGRLVVPLIEKTITGDFTKLAYLTNSLEYIVPLEYGWSAKAPEGMVRLNVVRFQGIVNSVVADLRNRK